MPRDTDVSVQLKMGKRLEMDKSLLSDKYISMYLSNHPASFEELFHRHIKCDCIFSKEYDEGTLFCLIHTKPSKNHRALDNALKLIEAVIGPGNAGSHFRCISNVLSKKVKTFTVGQHVSDEHYSAIFFNTTTRGRGERKVHPDVRTWSPPGDATNHEVQPKAPKRKRVVAAVGAAGEERDGTADGMQQATLESKSQVTRAFAVNVPVALIMLGANSVRAGYHQRAQGAGGRSRAACESIRGQRG